MLTSSSGPSSSYVPGTLGGLTLALMSPAFGIPYEWRASSKVVSVNRSIHASVLTGSAVIFVNGFCSAFAMV